MSLSEWGTFQVFPYRIGTVPANITLGWSGLRGTKSIWTVSTTLHFFVYYE
jgi:hypothetical protein